MKRKITRANEAAKVRLRAIEMYQGGGVTLRDVAAQFGVHITTISEWVKMYEEGGVGRLNAPMKPRPVHHLDAKRLAAELAADPGNDTLASLLDLATGKGLNETAEKFGISPQALAKRRRVYLKSKGVRKSITDGGRGIEAYEFYSPYMAAWVDLEVLGAAASQILNATS